MDQFDANILEFARRWLPYGGPTADDIWTEFGMTTVRYEQQLLTLLDSVDSRRMPSDIRAHLRAQVVERSIRRTARAKAASRR
ncbi:DUF3263 domain-containing protein (plasmid) [Rhodococcus sp. ZPP]|uniref:DUF3263 domain-containing protein n=1 Tax=Rhodococcus sp. ZPP TaxID=2749906 RepID=UPI001AD88486|nr:DUF3263 domain-containing protein [Rhodococcus sp. ZPP]QTJ70694.1 DUF3263 domain-containing protein [Rhodococcus sp. ZPP]